MEGNDEIQLKRLTADQIEEDWNRALDTASEAVNFCAASRLLTPAYAAREVALIGAERKWLAHIGPTLRRLFPPVGPALPKPTLDEAPRASGARTRRMSRKRLVRRRRVGDDALPCRGRFSLRN
jgi:hypothetical protein